MMGRVGILMAAAALGLARSLPAHPGHLEEKADALGHVHSHTPLEALGLALLPLALVWGLWAFLEFRARRRKDD